MFNLYSVTHLHTNEMWLMRSECDVDDFFRLLLVKSEEKGRSGLYKKLSQDGKDNFLLQQLATSETEDGLNSAQNIWEMLLKLPVSQRGSLSHRLKIASKWTLARRQKQSEIAKQINARSTVKDYVCPDCDREFIQISKAAYGGHRRACLRWARLARDLEKEIGKTLDEILET